MKKIGLFLLAVVMMTGLAGCSNSDDKLEVADMAGTYTYSSLTINGVPSSVSGSMTLTNTGAYSGSIESGVGNGTFSGTFTVNDPNITFIQDGNATNGVISDNGKTITYTIESAVFVLIKA